MKYEEIREIMYQAFEKNDIPLTHENSEMVMILAKSIAEAKAGQNETLVSVLDDCLEDINNELNTFGLDEDQVRMLEDERLYGKIFRKRIKNKLEAH